MEVVRGPRPGDVEGVVTHVGTDADVGQLDVAGAVQRDLPEHAALAVEVGAEVALCRDRLVARVDVALLDRAGDGVGEHRRAGRLGPVVRAVTAVDDLEPAAGLRVLVLLDPRGQLLQVRQDRVPARRAGRRDVEDHHRGHREPADRPAPRLGRVLGAGAHPGLGARLVVGVVQDAARPLRVDGVADQVVDGVVAGYPAVTDQVLVPRQERQRHERAVRPQLVLPAGGVPERVVRGTRVVAVLQALLDLDRGVLVLGLSGLLEQREVDHGRLGAVQAAEAVADVAAGVDEVVGPALDVLQQVRVLGALVEQVLAVEVQAVGVAPAQARRAVRVHHRLGHRLGPVGTGRGRRGRRRDDAVRDGQRVEVGAAARTGPGGAHGVGTGDERRGHVERLPRVPAAGTGEGHRGRRATVDGYVHRAGGGGAVGEAERQGGVTGRRRGHLELDIATGRVVVVDEPGTGEARVVVGDGRVRQGGGLGLVTRGRGRRQERYRQRGDARADGERADYGETDKSSTGHARPYLPPADASRAANRIPTT